MVIDSIIEFCKKELTVNGEIKKCYKFFFYFIPAIYLMFCISIIYLIKMNPYIAITLLTLLVTLMLFVKCILARKAIKKMNPDYVTNFLSWDRLAVRKEFDKRLEEYIQKEKLGGKEELLIELLNKRVQSIKTPYLLVTSIFSALFLVVFNEYVNKVYSIIGNNFNEATAIFLVFIALIVAIVYFCDTIRDAYFLFLTNYNSIQRLINLLEDRRISK